MGERREGERTSKERGRGKREDVEGGVCRHGKWEVIALGGRPFLLLGWGLCWPPRGTLEWAGRLQAAWSAPHLLPM